MHGIKEQFYFIWKKIAEKQTRAHYRKHYKSEIEKFEQYRDKKPKRKISKEMKLLKNYWGCYPFQYIRYEFYKKNCPLSIEEMKKYIPNFFAYYLFFPLFSKDYGVVTDDKSLSNSYFVGLNIAQPSLLFKYANECLLDEHNLALNEDETNQRISESKADKVFVKPTFGLGGKGIIVFNKTSENIYANKNGETLNANFIKSLGKDHYVIQEGLFQHDELNKIYPNSINTFRIMTEVIDGKAKILYAMLRMGQKGNQLDNASQHGLAIAVDHHTGKLANEAYTGLCEIVSKHPDTGFVFRDSEIFSWPGIEAFIISTASKFYEVKYLGWDVALTVNGPAIIEINAGAGLEFLQDCHGGVKDSYKIPYPKKYWYSTKYSMKNL